MLETGWVRGGLPLVAWVVGAGAALAGPPVVGPQQRIDVGGGTAAANETTGAVSPANPAEIVAAWNDWREKTDEDYLVRCGVALSMDGGASWTDFLIRPPLAYQSALEGDPMTAQDPRTGIVWAGAISFPDNGGLFVARKNPQDAFFQAAVMADVAGNADKGYMVAGRNQLTADSTRLYLTYNLGVVRSDDLGDTWTSPISLGPGLAFLPRIGPNGELYVAYWNWTNDHYELKRSLDGGVTFETRLIALRMDSWSVETDNPRFPGTFRVSPVPSFAVDPGGRLYAVWPDTTGQQLGKWNVDVYFSRSLDQGDTWSTPVILNGEGPNVGDQFFPWIEAGPTGLLHALYLDSRHTAQPDNAVEGFFDAYYAYSEDQGSTWNEIRLTPQSWSSDDDGLAGPQFIGDYLGMGVIQDVAYPIYLDTSLGDANIYTRKIQHCTVPGSVSNLTVDLSEDDRTVTFNWTDASFALDYTLYEDMVANGNFDVVSGSGTSGIVGISLPAPASSRFYLIAGANDCGIGPKQ